MAYDEVMDRDHDVLHYAVDVVVAMHNLMYEAHKPIDMKEGSEFVQFVRYTMFERMTHDLLNKEALDFIEHKFYEGADVKEVAAFMANTIYEHDRLKRRFGGDKHAG